MLRDEVLKILEDHSGTSISGSEIARLLGVSRTAVWNAVKGLKSEGCHIDCSTNKGYTFLSDNDILSERGIQKHLNNRTLGREIRIFRELPSTNDYLKEEARSGAPEGLVAIAETQTKGRGRFSRSFYSPYGTSIYMSILLRPPFDARDANLITVAAASAVARAVEETCGEEIKVKWVNDLLLHGKKICGILSEATLEVESGRLEYAVLGIGVNVNNTCESFPKELRSIATSLHCETGCRYSRNALTALILGYFEQYYENLTARGYIADYKKRLSMLGQKVQLIRGDRVEIVEAMDIDENASLIVKSENGEIKTVHSGEISVRSMNDGTK